MIGPTVAFFGSSLVSAYWNGAATYYRGLLRELHDRGYRITFYEPDAYERQAHRDIDDPPWARVVVYPGDDEAAAYRAVEAARDANILVKASGVGVYDALLEAAIPRAKRADSLAIFWDVDAPATLARLAADSNDPFHSQIPRYDAILTYGGGEPVIRGYMALGARTCAPIYNGLDPETHFQVEPEARFTSDLSLLANRLPDREARVDAFFLHAAAVLSDRRLLLAGNGWGDKRLPPNVRSIGHLSTRDHNAFNASACAVLNVSRDCMATNGFSPATRVFEAAGAGACIITDAFEGIDLFLEPNREILVAEDGDDVARIVRDLSPERARSIGRKARMRVLAEHTYARRAFAVDELLRGSMKGGRHHERL